MQRLIPLQLVLGCHADPTGVRDPPTAAVPTDPTDPPADRTGAKPVEIRWTGSSAR